MALPLSSNLSWEQANNLWAQSLNPIISNQLLQGHLISSIPLVANTPKTINHTLNRMQLGWFVVDNTANTAIWRTQDLNTKTITLESSVNTIITLWVF